MELTKANAASRKQLSRAAGVTAILNSGREGSARGRTSSPSSKRFNQATAEGALRYIEGEKLLTLVLMDTAYYQVAIEDLSEKIDAAKAQAKPSKRLLGLLVLPKGKLLSFGTLNDKVSALAKKRILVRTSALTDTLAGAEELKQEVMKHYATASIHASQLRSKQLQLPPEG